MPQPRVFVSRMMHQDALALIGEATDMEVWPKDPPPSAGDLRTKLVDAEGVLINIMDRIDTALLDAAPRLRVVSASLPPGWTMWTFPNARAVASCWGARPAFSPRPWRTTPSRSCSPRRAAWWRATGGCAATTGSWRFIPTTGWATRLQGSTLGIVGLGQIGLEMARRAQGFDMRILYHSRNRRPEAEAQYGLTYAAMDELLSESDYVSLHVPLTPETRHLIDADALRRMKSTAILVNISRGPVVDTDALCTALREGWIGGAGLDVVDPEPIPDDHPLLFMDNVTITPHIGSASVLSRRAMSIMAARNLVNGLNGQRLVHCANPELYERLGL